MPSVTRHDHHLHTEEASIGVVHTASSAHSTQLTAVPTPIGHSSVDAGKKQYEFRKDRLSKDLNKDQEGFRFYFYKNGKWHDKTSKADKARCHQEEGRPDTGHKTPYARCHCRHVGRAGHCTSAAISC